MHEVKDGRITLSTGVVFKVVNVPIFAFDKIKEKMEEKRPAVPVIHIEEKDRDEPNPNDPDYIVAMEKFDRKLNERLIDMVLTLGTELDSVPEGLDRAEEEGWAEPLKKLQIDIPDVEDKDARYMAWLKLCAMRTAEDLTSLVIACARGAGVTEEDVADATASFRGTKKR